MDKGNPTQFGRAMAELGIEMIAGYSPQARGRSERLFGTLQGRLPQELAQAEITGIDAANEFLKAFWPRFNASFAVEPKESESAFSPLLPSLKAKLPDVLCLKEERTVGNDNCVAYKGRTLQIPPRRHRCHYVASQGLGPRVRGRRRCSLPRDPEAGALRCRRPAAAQGRGGGTPKRTFHSHAPKTGHSICSRQLPTAGLLITRFLRIISGRSSSMDYAAGSMIPSRRPLGSTSPQEMV